MNEDGTKIPQLSEPERQAELRHLRFDAAFIGSLGLVSSGIGTWLYFTQQEHGDPWSISAIITGPLWVGWTVMMYLNNRDAINQTGLPDDTQQQLL